ncbi:hypothetical protein [Pseudomonas sp. BW16M2]|uniref:hypothetical protein n=1 Tax=Pseudomonas sp. BW16M2 TaxID=2745489 RepID=UPI001EE18182|nr:hypothetical protein [Pseudomonas sp. BW16M2]
MKQVAHGRYETVDQHRRSAEALAAGTQELAALERLEKRLSSEKKETLIGHKSSPCTPRKKKELPRDPHP